MRDVEELPWNGLNAVSTFSGAGGSCLGYRMAGYRVLWASEFVPAAAEVYKLNHARSHLDTRDIREVTPEDILRQTGLDVGELDLFDGSPPCASFSMAGKRERGGWGKVKVYSDTKQRVDDLFWEFARLLEGLQPRAFVAENVKGLVVGKAKGYFKLILRRLRDAGYVVRAKILDAQWLGVPQRRQRLIFVGVREDLGLEPEHPSPLPHYYTVRDACPWVDVLGAGEAEPESSIEGYAIEKAWEKLEPGESSDKYLNLCRAHPGRPSPTVTQLAGRCGGTAGVTHPYEPRKYSIRELKRICGFPDDFQLTGTYAQRWERLGRAVPPPMSAAVGRSVTEVLSGA